ncbi:MAG TPA: ester cyclase [Flavobacteriales bacterium]|nr:ester cyclase [Flavobacteriales bacterium]
MLNRILPVTAVLVIFSACGGGVTPEQQAQMDKEAANKAAFENIGKAWNTGDEKLLADNLADNFMTHNPDPMIQSTGKQQIIDQMKTYRGSSPDMSAEGKVMLVDGDWVAGVAMVKGTNTGDMGPGMPATGKAWEATGIDVMRFENGKAVELWTVFDVMKMMSDMGINMGGGADTTQTAPAEAPAAN